MDLAQLQELVEQPTPVGKNQLIFLCPNHRELCATAVMRGGELELSCDNGCSSKMLWAGIQENGGRHGAAGDPPTGSVPPYVGPCETPPAVHTESTGAGAEGAPPASAQPGISESTPNAVPPPPVKAQWQVEAERNAAIYEWERLLAGIAGEVKRAEPGISQEALQTELSESASNGEGPPTWLAMTGEEIDGSIAKVVGLLYRQTQSIVGSVPSGGLPDVFIRKKIEVLTWGQLRERRRAHVQNWAVEGWLARGETSMWSGKVEHGKTTLMRELTLCKVRGEPFLGQPCQQGRVFYAMLDADGEDLTFDEFEKMGMNDDDRENIRFLFEPMLARMENGPEQFFKELWDWRPDIVIIDPFARLHEIGDFNDYNNTYLMAMLSHYAKILNAHFALPGHIPRGRPAGSSAATAAFGSIAFGGGVNARFVVERKEGTDIHVVRSSKGKSAGFVAMEGERVLVRDEYTGRISLGKPFSFGQQAASLKSKVLQLINDAPLQDWTPSAIAKEIGAATGIVRAAAGMLFDDKKLERNGTGKKGSPFVYCKILGEYPIPAVDIPQGGLYRD